MKSRMLRWVFPLLVLAVGGGWLALVYRGVGGDMTQAAQAFLHTLSDEQRAQATMDFDDPARLDWHFIPKSERKGLQIKHMDDAQRAKAHALLKSGLSRLGYEKTTAVMGLEDILHELEKSRSGGNVRDSERYYFTIFGRPDVQGAWGWSVEGHHLSLNFVVHDGAVTAHTPEFYGANPAVVRHDHGDQFKAGDRVLAAEETHGFDLVNSLNAEQRAEAIIAEQAPADIRAAGEPQPPADAPAGIAAAELNDEQTAGLRELIKAYTDKMPVEVSEARWAEIEEAGLDAVHFVWAGALEPGVGHYYRVQGPTFLIEFVNVQPDPEGNPANHIHSIWRDMRGDFGIPR